MSISKYVSRAGEKMEFALKSFNVEVNGLVCADFGSSTGGFVDCLLQHGAGKVSAVETGYGLLDWKLRNDKRVVVMEKTNAVYVDLPEKVDLITIDAGWTRQEIILPSAYSKLKESGKVISLVKLSFESGREIKTPDETSLAVEKLLEKVKKDAAGIGFETTDCIKSPLTGVKGKNEEYLILLGKIPTQHE